MPKKILLINVYYGPFNSYFDFWLESVKANKSIDFLLVTDNELLYSPSNLRVLNLPWSKLQILVQSAFDFKVCLPHPYKLCDFKVAYGLIFEDYLCDFDFWGFCDVDLIFGNIRHFLTDEILNKYERFFSRGHFSLFRNNEEMSNFFKSETKLIPNWRTVLSSKQSYSFDEWQGTSKLMWNLKPDLFYDDFMFDDVKWSNYNFQTAQIIPNEKQQLNFVYLYKGGSLYRYYTSDDVLGKKEILYAHFQKRNIETDVKAKPSFLIIPNVIIDVPSSIDVNYLKTVGRNKFYLHYHKTRLKIWKKRLLDKLQ